jgi:hypothetical protein
MNMDWLLLFLAVPAVIVPIVLLCGFAGCRTLLGFEDPVLIVAPPENLRPESVGFDGITLTWDYLDPPPEPVTFEVEVNDTDPPAQTIVTGITGRFLFRSGLPSGADFFFRIRAVRTSDHVASDWVPDPALLVSTLIFETTFETTTNPPTPVGGVSLPGDCIVQRIPGAAITRGGSLVRITLQGLATQETRLDFVSLSQSLPTTAPEPWDSADPPVQVTFSGNPVVILQNGMPAVSDIISYPIAAGADLLIAFDVNATSQNLLRRTVTGAQAYIRNNTSQAAAQNRSAGYLTNNNLVHCVDKIEVAGPEPTGPIN